VLVVGADGDERLADVDAGNGAQRLAEGATHSSLKTSIFCVMLWIGIFRCKFIFLFTSSQRQQRILFAHLGRNSRAKLSHGHFFFFFKKKVARGGEQTQALSISFLFSLSPLYR
jgi:hypothetical protein